MKKLLITTIITGLASGSFNVFSQECHPLIPETTPDARFVLNDDETVSDLATGLVWKRCMEGKFTSNLLIPCGDGSAQPKFWGAALTSIETLNNTAGGFAQVTKWRLPNIKELNSILEYSCRYPAINTTVFSSSPGTDISSGARYWSSTTWGQDPRYAWNILARTGNATTSIKNQSQYYVRLVYDAN